MKTIKIFKLHPDAKLPTRNNPTDAALDLYALESVFIPLGSTKMIKTGIAACIEPGYVGLLRERSGVGKKGLKIAGGVIDAGYSGDVSMLLVNISSTEETNYDEDVMDGYQVLAGDRIAQLLVVPIEVPEVEQVYELWNSARSDKGFGNSGR